MNESIYCIAYTREDKAEPITCLVGQSDPVQNTTPNHQNKPNSKEKHKIKKR